MAGIPGHMMPILTGFEAQDEASDVIDQIFDSSFGYAASASTMALSGMSSIITSPVLPNTLVALPMFNAPSLSNNIFTLPLFVAPVISLNSPPHPEFSQVWAYTSEFLTALRSWVTTEITNGNLGLTEATQDDLFNIGLEKELQVLKENKDKASAQWAKGNWGKPDGVLLALNAKVEKAFNDKRYNASKAIRLECEKNALDRLRLAIEQGVKLEQVLMEYAPEMAKALAQAYGAEASAYKTEVSAQISLLDAFVRRYEAILRGRSAQAKLGFLADDMNISYADAEFSIAAANAELAVKTLELDLNIALSANHLSNMQTAGRVQVGAQLFAGAIASCHVQAHLGSSFDQSTRVSSSTEYTNTTAYSASTSE
jgi:hypothetical protein